MYSLESATVVCPCCGETIEVLVDCSVPRQCYIEDCEVCCRPIELSVEIDSSGVPSLNARDEGDC